MQLLTDDLSVRHGSIANPGSAITTAAIHNATQTVVTRSVDPTRVGVLDRTTRTITDTCILPEGAGAWASTWLDDKLYIGTYQPAILYRVDPAQETTTVLSRFPDAEFLWDLVGDSDTLYVGTWPTGRVHEIDRETGSTRQLSTPVPGEEYVRSLALTDDEVLAGIGARANLVGIDRATGETRSLFPEEYTTESFVYALAVRDGEIFAGMHPTGTMLRIDFETGTLREAIDVTAGHIAALALSPDGTLYVAAATSPEPMAGAELFAWTPEDGLSRITRIDGGSCCSLNVADSRLVGAGTHGTVWECASDGTDVVLDDLIDIGMPAGSEQAQSILRIDDGTLVGGHGRVVLHPTGSDTTRRIHIPGEPKAMVARNDTIYAGLYPGAAAVAIDLAAGTSRSLGAIGHDQDRPRCGVLEPETDSIYLGTAPEYGHLGGALVRIDPATDTIDVNRNLIPEQSISALATSNELLYLGSELRGGLGRTPTADMSRLGVWDPGNQSLRWTMELESVSAVRDLVVDDDRVIATVQSKENEEGHLLLIDADDRRILERTPLDGSPGSVVHTETGIYTVTEEHLFQVDRRSGDLVPVVGELEGNWFNWPMLSADSETIVTLAGSDLVTITTSK